MGKDGSSAIPSSPRSQELCTLVRRSAKTVGSVSERLSKSLMMPLFSATNTRPSGENSTTVGYSRPSKTTESWKPGGSGGGAGGGGGAAGAPPPHAPRDAPHE